MEGIQNKIRKCSFVTLFLVFSFLFGATNMRVASFPNEDISSTAFEADNEELYCSKESCQELRERVESLEEAVRAIVSTLSDESLQHFTAVIEKSSKNRGVQSVLSAPISTSEDAQEEENSPTETPYSSRPAKPSINYQTNQSSLISNSVHHLKHAVKCSLAHMLDIHVSENNGANNHSAGILNATLFHQAGLDKSIEIEWSPPLASCIEFSTGLWVRVYESGTEPASEPYLSIPKKCLKSKQHPSGREALSILLPSLNSSIQNSSDADCTFPTKTLVVCRSYQVEVVPNYQSLKGKSIQAEIIVPPTMETMTRLKAFVNASALVDSLTLSWEDNSGCASRLTSINLRLWADGVMVPNKLGNGNSDRDHEALKTSVIEPIIYRIPSTCLFKQEPHERNLLFVILSSGYSCGNVWKPLDKCRKYTLEMESQYSSAWNGPKYKQTVFTSSMTPDALNTGAVQVNSIPFDYTGAGRCPRDQFYCQSRDSRRVSDYRCSQSSWLCDGAFDCGSVSTLLEYQHIHDESYCAPTHCYDGFKCGKQCIPEELVCDGKRDCYVGDEEVDCPDLSPMCQHYTSPKGNIIVAGLNSTKLGHKEGPTSLLISAIPNQVIWLDFAKLDASKRTIVKVYDGPYSTSPLLLSHDDYQKPSSVRSTGPNLYIEYYSYKDETQAYYTTIDKTEQPFVKGCGGYVNGDGILSNPDWGKILEGNILAAGYPNDCFWYIEARYEGGTLLLKRDNIERELDVSDQQLSNSVIVYDGWNPPGAVLYDDRSKKTTNDIIYSLSNKMLVRFIRPSDSTPLLVKSSWNVTTIFTPNCREYLNISNTDGLLKSPNFPATYSKFSDCRWTITGAPGSTIRLLFSFFETQENEDFINIYDGPTVYHPLLMVKSGIVSTPFVVNSSSNQVLVRFTTSDVGKPSNGFLAVYSAVQSNPLLNRLLGSGIQTLKDLN